MPLNIDEARRRLRADLNIDAEPDDPIFACYYLVQLALDDLRPETDKAIGESVADAKANMTANLAAIRSATEGLTDLREGMDATAKGAQTALTVASRLEAASERLVKAAKARQGVSWWMILLAAAGGSVIGTAATIAALPYF